MATAYIGNQLLKAVKPGERDEHYWDEEVTGFALKITTRGSKTYIFRYRLGGRAAPQKTITIGQHGTWTPLAARDEAKRLRRLVDRGIDPRHEELQRQRERISLEIESYAGRFTDQYLSERWVGSIDMASRMLRKHVVPVWKGRYLKEITRADVAALIHGLKGKGVRRNTFAVLRKMFRWAVNNGDIDASPMADMDAPAAPDSRDRVLSDDELAMVWTASSKLGYPYGQVVQLLILTGQRRNEVTGMGWGELKRDGALWVIPKARAKNNVASEVPLSVPAIAILDGLARLALGLDDDEPVKAWPKAGFVFTTTGKTAVSGHSKAKARLDRQIVADLRKQAEEAGHDPSEIELEDWRFHDLRRTLATGLQRFGINKEVTEAVLNHVSGSISGIARVYQRHDYKDEKRAALGRWAQHVAAIAPEA